MSNNKYQFKGTETPWVIVEGNRLANIQNKYCKQVCIIEDFAAEFGNPTIYDAHLIAASSDLLEACKVALKQISDLEDVLNQPNLSVVGWHLNGDHEPAQTFFRDNDHNALHILKAAIHKALNIEAEEA